MQRVSKSVKFTPVRPPYGSIWARKIADFFFLPYTCISFIIAFTALEWIPYMESLYNQSG